MRNCYVRVKDWY